MTPDEYTVKLNDGSERTVTAMSHDMRGQHDFISFYDQPEGGDEVYTVSRDRVDEIIPVEEGEVQVA